MFQGRGPRRQVESGRQNGAVLRKWPYQPQCLTFVRPLLTFQSIQPRRTNTESSEWCSKTLVLGESCLDCGKVARRPH